MPFPYQSIPTDAVWKSDSSAFFAIRANDRVLLTIDRLVAAYHQPALAGVQQETLFYLRSALLFWLKKVNAVPKNTAPTGLNATNLPTTVRFSGSTSREAAVHALLVIVNGKLRELTGVESDRALTDALMTAYGADNRGVASDQAWLARYANVSVFLTDEGIQRKYKLRFRAGIAWRWNPSTNSYGIFDSTDNAESESNDRMVHFVMDRRGRIYAGFDKDAIWFKHSSLVGGENALAAGRMQVTNGVITLIENDSGHYAPVHQHMRNLLHRLTLYGCDLDATEVRRISDKARFPALQVQTVPGSWPDGQMGH